jgi:glutamyl-tRNA reductase
VVGRGFEPRSGQIKNYDIVICCFSAKHATVRRKNNDWLTRNQDDVSEWGDIPFRGL